MAIDKGMVGEAALMMEKRANPDAADKDGKTALVMAIDKGKAGEAALMMAKSPTPTRPTRTARRLL